MKRLLLLLFLSASLPCIQPARSQTLTPEVTAWLVNTDGETGYNGIPSNVQQVQFSDDNAYVSCTCIPGYDIGPWAGNPNIPANQDFTFKITRHPLENTGAPIPTGLGHTGVWTNGVSLFNALDGMSYNNQGIWHRDALVWEGSSFDNCLGHPAPNGEYHHHVNPTCLYDDSDDSQHSPLIGFAFDGFPIYGTFAFSGTDGSGVVRRMESSYRLRGITERTSLPDGTQLAAGQYGPAVAGQFPLGSYIEDWEFVTGLGDLDEHNGRFSVTPDYPQGTYAYFVTLDAQGEPLYPYAVGPTYYGTVQAGNTGPQSGHNVPAEPVETYIPTAAGETEQAELAIFPNPAQDALVVESERDLSFRIFDALGRLAASGRTNERLDLAGLSAGICVIRFEAGSFVKPVVFVKN